MSFALMILSNRNRSAQKRLGGGNIASADEQKRVRREASRQGGVVCSQAVPLDVESLADRSLGGVEISSRLKDIGHLEQSGGELRVRLTKRFSPEVKSLGEKRLGFFEVALLLK